MGFANSSAGSMFGHSWIELTNLTDSQLCIGHYIAVPNEHISIGLWGNPLDEDDMLYGVHSGVWYNRESYAYYVEGKYQEYYRKGVLVSIERISLLTNYTNIKNFVYTFVSFNCTNYAMTAWDLTITDTQYKIYYPNVIGVPQILESKLKNMDGNECVTSMFEADVMAYYDGTSLVTYYLE